MKVNKTAIFIITAVSIAGCKSTPSLESTSSNLTNSSIVGDFKNITSSKNSSIELRLNCTSESQCELTTISISEKHGKSSHIDNLENIEPAKNLKIAQNALHHAINNQSTGITMQQKLLMEKLKPSLKNNPSVNKCWDLNYPTPEYSLACTFTNTKSNESPIFLFFTTLSRCNGAFCRYIIYPMQRI